MSQKIRIIAASVLLVLGVSVFTATLVHAVFYAQQDSTAPDSGITAPSASKYASSATATSSPARLKIPSLGVDAAVQHVGLGKTGNMAVPTNYSDVGWYRLGAAPGQEGSAVIDGHVDNGLGLPGVFKHLGDIRVGDEIDIQTAEGATVHFVVSDIEAYPYKEVPTAQVFGDQGVPMLNLITCEGSWVGSDKTYDHRLVVYATLRS